MMALGLLIYAVRNTFTFDSGDTISEMLGSTWVTSVGRGRNSLLAVIFNSFFGVLIFGKAGFSSQLWMLRPLLIGQISFFIFSYSDYVKNKFVRNISVIAVSKVWNSTIDVWCNKLVNSICTVIGRMVQ